jgi:hypothetical protein
MSAPTGAGHYASPVRRSIERQRRGSGGSSQNRSGVSTTRDRFSGRREHRQGILARGAAGTGRRRPARQGILARGPGDTHRRRPTSHGNVARRRARTRPATIRTARTRTESTRLASTRPDTTGALCTPRAGARQLSSE